MKFINETERLVVYGEPTQEWRSDERVCLYKHDGKWQCADLLSAQYSHFYWLCGDDGLAQQAEAGTLLVNKRRVPAEKYLALWRSAFEAVRPINEVPVLALTWEVCIERARLALNRPSAKGPDSPEPLDVNSLLAYASKYRIAAAEGLMHWSLPFGKAHFGQMAHTLANLGEVRYRLPPGSFKRLSVVRVPEMQAPTPDSPDLQLDLLEMP